MSGIPADFPDGVIQCPWCAVPWRAEDAAGACRSCGKSCVRTGRTLCWTDPAARPWPARPLTHRLLDQLNPVASRLSPLKWLTDARVERYYRRIMVDQEVARLWSRHYLAGATLPHGARVLDHGCGRGRHVALLAQLGYEVFAQDVASHPGWPQLPGAFQVVPPTAPGLPWTSATFDLVLGVMVIHHMDTEAIARFASEVHRVLAPGGTWLLLEANDESYGARLPRKLIGRLHALADVRRAAEQAGFVVRDVDYEGVYASVWPRFVNVMRKVVWPGAFDVADYGSWLESTLEPRRRALWRLRLEKPIDASAR